MEKDIGTLIVETSAADRALPVSGAEVIIYKNNNNSIKELVAKLTTDENGLAKPIHLETISKNLSLSPGDDQPYTSYNIKISHPKYQTKHYTDVPIFQDVITIQNVLMLPVESNFS